MHNCLVCQKEKLKSPKKGNGQRWVHHVGQPLQGSHEYELILQTSHMHGLFLSEADPCSEQQLLDKDPWLHLLTDASCRIRGQRLFL